MGEPRGGGSDDCPGVDKGRGDAGTDQCRDEGPLGWPNRA